LSREEEVAIAKEIEAGKLQVADEVFSVPLALHYVVTMAEKLKTGELEARQVLFEEDDEGDSPEKEQRRVQQFLKAVAPLKRTAAERDRLGPGSKANGKQLAQREKKLKAVQDRIKAGLIELELGERHIA